MKSKKSWKQSIFSYVGLVFSVVVLFVVGHWAWGNYELHKHVQSVYIEASEHNETLQSQLHDIEERNALLGTKTGQQDFLIKKYALMRTGERVLILVQDDTSKPDIPQDDDATVWHKIRSWFGRE